MQRSPTTYHDDLLRDTDNCISFTVQSSIEQMIRRLFERCNAKNTVFHLCDTMTSDA